LHAEEDKGSTLTLAIYSVQPATVYESARTVCLAVKQASSYSFRLNKPKSLTHAGTCAGSRRYTSFGMMLASLITTIKRVRG